jgi:hypothetical protein
MWYTYPSFLFLSHSYEANNKINKNKVWGDTNNKVMA